MTEHVITHLVALIAQRLMPRYSDEDICVQHAWWMLHAITAQNKASLIAQHTIVLTADQQETIDAWIARQVDDQYPLDYLIGFVSFGDLAIQVKPPTLIPRPETEEWILNLIEQLKPVSNQPLTILDMCTGSGCIALALAHALPHATIYGVDIEPRALELARTNAQHNGINNVIWMQSDLFLNLPADLRFDIVVSNPPYISHDEWHMVEPSVSRWEDAQALLAPDDGLAILSTIIKQTPAWLKENSCINTYALPQLTVEIGAYQGKKVAQLFDEASYQSVRVTKDLAGNDRTVAGRITNVATAANT